MSVNKSSYLIDQLNFPLSDVLKRTQHLVINMWRKHLTSGKWENCERQYFLLFRTWAQQLVYFHATSEVRSRLGAFSSILINFVYLIKSWRVKGRSRISPKQTLNTTKLKTCLLPQPRHPKRRSVFYNLEFRDKMCFMSSIRSVGQKAFYSITKLSFLTEVFSNLFWFQRKQRSIKIENFKSQSVLFRQSAV